MNKFFVYILTNSKRSIFYSGVTSDLGRRLLEHYFGTDNLGHATKRYSVYYLVYYETFSNLNDAHAREIEIKALSKKKKQDLIRIGNPEMKFLNLQFVGDWPPRKTN